MSYNDVTKERVLATPKKLLPIPLIGSDENRTVAAACIEAVLGYFDIDLNRDVPQLGDLSSINGVESMAAYLTKVKKEDCDTNRLLGIDVRRYMTVCDLMEDIDQDIPVICPIQAWYKDESGEYDAAHDYKEENEYGHYVVAVGYDNGFMYFLDPAKSDTYTYIPIQEFDVRWHNIESGERYVHTGIRVKLNCIGCKVGYTCRIM